MLAHTTSLVHVGLQAELIDIQADISNGLPAFVIVGLGSKAIDEAKERIRSSLKNSGLALPPRRITLNLAPADLPKNSSGFDLGMAVGLLAASGQIPQPDRKAAFFGELGLDGSVRSTSGALAVAIGCEQAGIDTLFLATNDASIASFVRGLQVVPVKNLKQLFQHLVGDSIISPVVRKATSQSPFEQTMDMANIYGQAHAKRALEIAASGNHNILLSGSPGAGKTMLAKALVGILPSPSYDEQIEITRIHSLASVSSDKLITTRPFRTPHHTSSDIALIGGGQWPKPGEISLAHRGVLFMDEFPEFPRHVLEVLRQPLEEGIVSIARAQASLQFPAQFLMIAAQNPCPCGYLGDDRTDCTCSLAQIQRYQQKVSGPLLDRIDLHVSVGRLEKKHLLDNSPTEEASNQIRQRVCNARAIQAARFTGSELLTNSEMTNEQIRKYCVLTSAAEHLAESAIDSLSLSARSYMRTLKLARTIADLDANSTHITEQHIAEALQYRFVKSQTLAVA
jgi:magnesium chelatase family protein